MTPLLGVVCGRCLGGDPDDRCTVPARTCFEFSTRLRNLSFYLSIYLALNPPPDELTQHLSQSHILSIPFQNAAKMSIKSYIGLY